MSKRIIYTNEISQVDLDQAEENLIENGNDSPNDNEIWKEAGEMANLWLSDERENLNIEVDGIESILVIAGLGLWNGRKSGYKIIDSTCLNSIFEVGEEFNTYFYENRNVKAECVHHDGTNYYVFRGVRKGANIDILLNKIYEGMATRHDINRYTVSLYNPIKQIYG